ncbi:unnamed protein product, partial [Heterosigma akashiwo]
MVDELLKQGVIEESSSEFNAPIVLVQKKTGDLRMCLDLRCLNQITKKAKFPLPTTREIEGIKPDPKKIEAVKGMRRPASKKKQVRQFLGLASYYRQFVEGFSEIAKPLYQLTKDTPKGVEWTDDCEWSWQTLKDKLVSTPILIYPRFDRPFIVETDASGQGLGAVLSQETDHGRKPVAYASRVCSSTEANYSATELECLGVIYAVQQFRCYILG